MKKLEDRIVKKVYKLETKNTLINIVFKSTAFIILVFFIFILGSTMMDILTEQKSFAFLDIFKENSEVIKKYLVDNLSTFYLEIPKEILGLLLIAIILFIFIILTIVKNFTKIKNKVFSIYKFYKNKYG